MIKAHDHDPNEHHTHSHGAQGHTHCHGHHHDHSQLPAKMNRAFALGILLNITFVVIEFSFGVISGSMALMADAGHNLSDVLGLALAWGAMRLAQSAPSARFTYGLKRTTILAALLNAVVLLVAVGAIAWEAIERFNAPSPVDGKIIMAVAGIGFIINGFTAFLFTSGRKSDLNVQGAFLHMVADALVSLGVVVTGAVVLLTGWVWLDAAVSLTIATIIMWGTWGLLRSSVELSLDAVPSSVNQGEVEKFLRALPGVEGVHHLHIWSLSTTEIALTAHMLVPTGLAPHDLLEIIQATLKNQFGIAHTTIQLEQVMSHHCGDCAQEA